MLMFSKDSLQIIDGICDFIGDTNDDYILDQDKIAVDRIGTIDIETEVITSLCSMLLNKYTYINPKNYRNMSILDVGCGFGHTLQQLEFKNRYGMDISIERLKTIPSNIIRVRAQAEDIPFYNKSCDVVICTDMLEHVKDVPSVASELDRVLKLYGTLILAFPWKQDLDIYKSEEYLTKWNKYKWIHLRSCDDTLVATNFPNYHIITSTFITAQMRFQTIKPYKIKFYELLKYVY